MAELQQHEFSNQKWGNEDADGGTRPLDNEQFTFPLLNHNKEHSVLSFWKAPYSPPIAWESKLHLLGIVHGLLLTKTETLGE